MVNDEFVKQIRTFCIKSMSKEQFTLYRLEKKKVHILFQGCS